VWGTIATSDEAAMVGGPIEARGFDEIVDFLVAILAQQLCYQLHRGSKRLLDGHLHRNNGHQAHFGTQGLGKICVTRVTFGRAFHELPHVAGFSVDT
jgi:hypothetical protein